MKVNEVKVYMRFTTEDILVGELVLKNREIWFKYATTFLKKGFNISPYKLPLIADAQRAKEVPFEGLFGVFDDSLPDGWGRLLLHRKMLEQGQDPNSMSPLDHLSLVGEEGSGALIYKPQQEHISRVDNHLNLDFLNEQVQLVLKDKGTDILEDLRLLGGSSGGARPKINIQYNILNDEIRPDLGLCKEGFEKWMVKFPAALDYYDAAQIEYAYYLMAIDAGLEMMPSKLLETSKGNLFFATKRFDRVGNDRLHRVSMAGLVHDNFRYSNIDYGHVLDAAFTLEQKIEAYEKVIRLACFNVLSHNRDDHSKNFSFLMNEKGKCFFSPVYDLTFSSSSHGMHSTTIAGEGVSPGYEHLKKLAVEFKIERFDEIYSQVKRSVQNWSKFAELAGVSSKSQKFIDKKLKG